ncbi:hypothetical protein [Acidipropionibacterium virtanenii]|uniref:Uncharacterized protein n=1 Tax=Acidipropionibacterium virtanenii TaxID=2057246 RepID=A0A344UPU2_9ACTN|nr:hypothetical protein [Acidipropionibacterium virtanenii]AXE37290.1 hypothetical protein JS278_00093 [Acidipropionibacterium virtanenii]
MSDDRTVDNVPGVSSERLVELVAEAERGYNFDEDRTEWGPGALLLDLDEDQRAAVLARAFRDRTDPASVVRAALAEYLATA